MDWIVATGLGSITLVYVIFCVIFFKQHEKCMDEKDKIISQKDAEIRRYRDWLLEISGNDTVDLSELRDKLYEDSLKQIAKCGELFGKVE